MPVPTNPSDVAILMKNYFTEKGRLQIAIADKMSENRMKELFGQAHNQVIDYNTIPRSVQELYNLQGTLLELRLNTHELLVAAACAAQEAGAHGLKVTITYHINNLNLLLWEAATRHRKEDGTVDWTMAGGRSAAFRGVPRNTTQVSVPHDTTQASAVPNAADLVANPTAGAVVAANPANQSEKSTSTLRTTWWYTWQIILGCVTGAILGLLCVLLAPLLAAAVKDMLEWLGALLAAAFWDVLEWLASLLKAPCQALLEWQDQSRRAKCPYVDFSRGGRTGYRYCNPDGT